MKKYKFRVWLHCDESKNDDFEVFEVYFAIDACRLAASKYDLEPKNFNASIYTKETRGTGKGIVD